MSCQYKPDYQIANNVTYSQFSSSILDNLICAATYLRPDPGGAMLPWLYTLFLLLFHLPACIIRAVRWESAQYLALGLALFNIAITVQSYVSTKLEPSEVLVWMPLTLMLDIGAMLQMVILILEMEGHGLADLRRALADQVVRIWRIIASGLPGFRGADAQNDQRPEDAPAANDVERGGAQPAPNVANGVNEEGAHELAHLRPRLPQHIADGAGEGDANAIDRVGGQPVRNVANGENEADRRLRKEREERERQALVEHALVALFAAIFGIILLVLQIYGLVAARKGMNVKDLTVNWCSPTFRNFDLAVTTGNCVKYDIISSSSNGIGCIALPASRQKEWLKGTVAALSVSLFFQVIDLLLVKFVDKQKFVNGTRLRRPWFSMFGGALVLIVLIYYGADTADSLPPGVTDVVWVYSKEPRAEIGRVCQVQLKSPGLRGMIIGWTDGVFNSWGSVYNGKEVIKAIRTEL